jgi:hypothetical protein
MQAAAMLPLSDIGRHEIKAIGVVGAWVPV